MQSCSENRVNYRRYEDRRVALLLNVHEIIFYEQDILRREEGILAAIAENYQVERVAMILVKEDNHNRIGIPTSLFGKWAMCAGNILMMGRGFERLLDLHSQVEGALTFEAVRKPEIFDENEWVSLWRDETTLKAKSLLSVEIVKPVKKILLMQQVNSSREWSSRDRNLIEEVAQLISIVEERQKL